jgi:hypothetical protein
MTLRYSFPFRALCRTAGSDPYRACHPTPYDVGMTLDLTVALVVYALACTRLTGLVVADDLTEPMRDRIVEWLDRRTRRKLAQKLALLITCFWCSGMWVWLFAAPLIWFHWANPVLLIPAIAFAGSQVTGMLSNVGR